MSLRDKDPDVRKKATNLLYDMGDKRAIEPLKEVAYYDQNNEVREAAKNALEKLQKC